MSTAPSTTSGRLFLHRTANQCHSSPAAVTKTAWAGRLVQRTVMSPSSGGWEGPDQGASRLRSEERASWPTGGCLGPGSSPGSYQGADPVPEGPTPVTNRPPKATPPNTHIGDQASRHERGERRQTVYSSKGTENAPSLRPKRSAFQCPIKTSPLPPTRKPSIIRPSCP